jgi:hypothetical protein
LTDSEPGPSTKKIESMFNRGEVEESGSILPHHQHHREHLLRSFNAIGPINKQRLLAKAICFFCFSPVFKTCNNVGQWKLSNGWLVAKLLALVAMPMPD